MFNIIKRGCQLSWQTNHARIFILRLQNYASFQLRDVLHERADETGTLLINFAKHIAAERHQSVSPTPTTIRYADYFPVSDERYFRKELNKTPADQMASLFIFASTYRSNAQPDKFVSVLNALDDASLKQMSNMTAANVLNTLYGLLFFAPHWLTRMDFYYAAMERLAAEFRGNEPKEHFVQLCFYLAMAKNRSSQQVKDLNQILNKHLNTYLPQLNAMDLAIVSNAAYKTSTVVDSNVYEQHLIQVATQIQLNDNNCALLVTLIKAMRIQRVRSPAVCQRLTNIVTKPEELQKFDARGLAHIYAYFAENLWDEAKPNASLNETFLKVLNEQNQQSYLRAKDVATFIWCCAQLNAKLTIPQMQAIEQKLLRQARNDEFKYFSDQLVDVCLSLWILGYKSRALLNAAVTHKENTRFNSKQQPKVDSRYTVLLTAVGLEEPNWLDELGQRHKSFNIDTLAPVYILKNNQELCELAERLANSDGVRKSSLIMPINGINIPSLLLDFSTKDEKVLIEYLRPEQTLQFSGQCVSVLRLKVRLLEALGYKTIMLKHNELQDENALKDILATIQCDKDVQQSVGNV